MVQGKKTTEKFDKRINIRITAQDWHLIMLLAQKERLSPSAWLRNQIGKLINNKEQEK
jgi:predicted HicB family RNase H-like nuclease